MREKENERGVQATLPPVKEGLYDLRADGVACQVVNSIKVFSPERETKEEWHLLLQDGLNHKVEVCVRKAC